MKKILRILVICIFCSESIAFGGEANVIKAAVTKNSDNTYNFEVTVAHMDTGWEHYADKWDIIDEQGTVLATRVLHHPHAEEQPFTRSLSRVTIPENLKAVTIRAHDSVHAYGGKVLHIHLPK